MLQIPNHFLLTFCRHSGKICILDIDVQGVKAVKATSDLGAKYVFIKPPSMKVLEQRLRDRMTESEESLQKELQILGLANASHFGFVSQQLMLGDQVWSSYVAFFFGN